MTSNSLPTRKAKFAGIYGKAIEYLKTTCSEIIEYLDDFLY
jgi:hypothetical protein